MPVPAIGIALALGLGLLALSSKKGPSAPAGPAGAPLDPGMPPAVDEKLRQLLATSTDPQALETLASIVETRGYHNAGAALRARAAQLRGQVAVPGVPLPSVTPSAVPPSVAPPSTIPASAVPGIAPPTTIPGLPNIPGLTSPAAQPAAAPAPTPAVPGMPSPATPPMPPAPPAPNIEDLDPNIPDALARSVAAILAKPDLNDQEIAFAEQLANTCDQSGFPKAAAKLRAKTLAIRAAHAGSGLLTQIANVLAAPASSLPPLPIQLPGITISQTPGAPAAPTAPAPAVPIPVAPPAAAPGAQPPVAPLAKTYKVLRGDNPSKIAKKFTGDDRKYKELAAANPDKSSRILDGRIFEGETLTLPDAWPAKPGAVTTSTPAPAAPPQTPAPIVASVPIPTTTPTATAPGAPIPFPIPAGVPTTPVQVSIPGMPTVSIPIPTAIPGITVPAAATPSVPGFAVPATSTPAASNTPLSSSTYLVKSGDTPSAIAKRFTGDPNRWRELGPANPSKADRILNHALIYAGEALNLPPTWSAAGKTAGYPSTISDAIAGVMDIIGARHPHANQHRNGLGSYRHHR